MNEKTKVLIVDDDVALCESLVDTLELEGYLTETAYTAKDGINKVEQDFYNIVLQDLELPDSDGIMALEKTKNISPDTEVIIFTAYAETDRVIAAMDKHAFSFLCKPFEIQELKTTLNNACEKQSILYDNCKLFKQVSDDKYEWESTFDSISDLISIHNIDAKIIKCSKAYVAKHKAKYQGII